RGGATVPRADVAGALSQGLSRRRRPCSRALGLGLMSLLLLLLLPFLGSAAAALLPTGARDIESSWAGLVALAVAVPLALLYPEVRDGGVVVERLVWLPSLGLDLLVRIDGFAWMFAMLVTGMGVLVVMYARYYLSPDDPAAR